VGSIPAVRIAAINSRSAISDLLLLHGTVNADRTPWVPRPGSQRSVDEPQYAMTLDLAEEELAALAWLPSDAIDGIAIRLVPHPSCPAA
jgi:hypothetical protein